MKVKTLGTWKVGKGEGKQSEVFPPGTVVDHAKLGIKKDDVEKYVKKGVLSDGSGDIGEIVVPASTSIKAAEKVNEEQQKEIDRLNEVITKGTAANAEQQNQIDELMAKVANLEAPAQ